MRLKVIIDNNTNIDEYYWGEPGVCYYIEDGKEAFLLMWDIPIWSLEMLLP